MNLDKYQHGAWYPRCYRGRAHWFEVPKIKVPKPTKQFLKNREIDAAYRLAKADY